MDHCGRSAVQDLGSWDAGVGGGGRTEAVELVGPQETVHGPKVWEAQE